MTKKHKTTVSVNAIGFPGVLTVALIVLKLTGVIDWSWFWVLFPVLLPFLVIIFIVLVLLLFALFNGGGKR